MATIARVAVSEYLRIGCEPDAEYVDGEIEERPAGEFDHARWQSAIQRSFLAQPDRWNVWVLPELRVQVSPTRFRVPDVTIIDRSLPREQIITRPPVAVVEVLSPEDRVPRMLIKLQDYEQMGLKNILNRGSIEWVGLEVWAWRAGAECIRKPRCDLLPAGLGTD